MLEVKIFLFSLLFTCSTFDALAAVLKNPKFYKKESVWKSKSGQKFRLCRISSNGALRLVKKKKIRINFSEDSDRVTNRFRQRIKKFFKTLPKNTFKISLTAHADSCGSHDYNHDLAKKRGVNVYNLMKNLVPRGVSVRGENHGEENSSGHKKHDKFVEIVAEYWKPKESISQIVLFDVSGSLHKRKIGHTVTGFTLKGLQQLKLKAGTMAYVPRDIR